MKRLFLFLLFLFVALNCFGQFANTNGNKFPYTNGLNSQDVFIIGTPGVTNKNIAASNMLSSLAVLTTTPLPSAILTYAGTLSGTNIMIGTNNSSQPNAYGAIMIGENYSANLVQGDGIKIGRGNGDVGAGSIAIGHGAGSALNSVSVGYESDAFGIHSVVIGASAIADGAGSTCIGYGTSDSSLADMTLLGALIDVSGAAPHWMVLGTTTTTNTIIQGRITANGTGITNLNADNISSGTVGSSRGGAGTVNGVLKANGSGTVSAAAAADVYGLWTGTGTYLTRFGTNATPAGAGDVTQSGQNNFSGSNYFGGATRFDGAIEIGAASDTTLARSSAGNLSIEGNVIYRAGGTDVAVADGGTGISSGTSGGILGFTASGTLASSAALAANAIVIGGGAGATPTTTTTASGALTFLGTPTSANFRSLLTDESGTGVILTANGDGSALTGLTASQIGPSGAVSNGQASVTFGTINTTTFNTTTLNATNQIFYNGSSYNVLVSGSAGTRTNTLPDKTGTFAMTSDVSDATNGLATAIASGSVNGAGLTNLTYNFRTNGNNTGVITLGQMSYTNITGNITIAGFSGVTASFWQWGGLWATNSTSTDYKITFAASVKTSTNNFVVGQDVWVTNRSAVKIDVGVGFGTNVSAVKFQ